jgi:FMN phosphatase YigB (HAD superfamily)
MHFTLDVWNTLFIPNPHYAMYRNKLLADKLRITERKASEIYSLTKMKLDTLAREHGVGMSTESVYIELTLECCKALKISFRSCDRALDSLEYEFRTLFLKHQPYILPETFHTIQKLQQDHSFSIISNTNFITGALIKKIITSRGLFFDSFMFSDLEGIAKPSPHMFKKALWKMRMFEPNDVYHIGDDPICDDPRGVMKHIIISHANALPEVLMELTK